MLFLLLLIELHYKKLVSIGDVIYYYMTILKKVIVFLTEQFITTSHFNCCGFKQFSPD